MKRPFLPILGSVLVLSSLSSGCALFGHSIYPAPQGLNSYPEAVALSKARQEPWARLIAVEETFGPSWRQANYGLAADGYAELGNDFVAVGDPSVGARAYWTALSLVARAETGRPFKEAVRLKAFRGLQSVAEQRGQHRWARLLGLCADLTSVYLKSPQANQDQQAFSAEQNRLNEAAARARQAKQAAANASSAEAFGLLLGSVALQAQGATATSVTAADVAATAGLLQRQMEFSARQDDTEEKYKRVMAEVASQRDRFQSATAEELAEVKSGKTFVGRETAFYLANAADQIAYLQVLERFAEPYPAITTALLSYLGGEPDGLRGLASAIQKEEVLAFKSERARGTR